MGAYLPRAFEARFEYLSHVEDILYTSQPIT